MKYYIAGPMTGIPHHNIPLFEAAAGLLRKQGFDVITPIELDDSETYIAAKADETGNLATFKESLGTLLGRDLMLIIDDVDGVIVLPGWEKSRGARLEVFTALSMDKSIFDLYGMEEYEPTWILDILKENMT